MAENKILPWAQTGTANVLSDADYASDVASGGLYGDGVKSGQASSKQANKTWRQATAPGSGLAQFIVDNLALDVTDSDTPATFSTRIANAVLKLAQISPFNQSWATATGGYRKYAIVSDSSGNFWVSTADQNTTVPGASGAMWKSLFDGYATQAWAQLSLVNSGGGIGQDGAGDHHIYLGWDGNLKATVDKTDLGNIALENWANSAFVKNNAGTQGGIVALDLDGDGSGRVTFRKTDGSWGTLQLAGDYATNPALNTEITNRTNADTNLQSQINNRVHQGGGVGQGNNTVYIGWASDASGLKATVDISDLGTFAFEGWCNNTFLKLTGGNVTGNFTYNDVTVATKNDVNSAETDVKNWTTSNYLSLTGGNVNGAIECTKYFSAGINGGWNGARTNTGDYGWTNGLAFGNPIGDGKYRGTWTVTDVLNEAGSNSSGLNLTGYDAAGKTYQWYFAWNGNIQTPKGLVAFESDISNLQNQINGKQPAGNYVSASVYSDDFSTSDSRVINLPYGHRIQAFAANGPNITFPQSFSGDGSNVIVVARQTNSGNSETQYTYDITATGCKIGGSSLYNFIVIGPR